MIPGSFHGTRTIGTVARAGQRVEQHDALLQVGHAVLDVDDT